MTYTVYSASGAGGGKSAVVSIPAGYRLFIAKHTCSQNNSYAAINTSTGSLTYIQSGANRMAYIDNPNETGGTISGNGSGSTSIYVVAVKIN